MFHKAGSMTGHVDDPLLHLDQDIKSASAVPVPTEHSFSSQATARVLDIDFETKLVNSVILSNSDRRPAHSSLQACLTSSGWKTAEKTSESESLYSEPSPTEQTTAYMRPSAPSNNHAPLSFSNSNSSPSSTNSSLPNSSPPFPDSSSPVLSDSSSNNPSSSPPRTPLPGPITIPVAQYTKHYFGQRPETPPDVRSLALPENSASPRSSTRPSGDLECIEDNASRTAPITPDFVDFSTENYISPGSNQTKFTRRLHELLLGVISDRDRAYFTDPDVDDADSSGVGASHAYSGRSSLDSNSSSSLLASVCHCKNDDPESMKSHPSDGFNLITGISVLDSSRENELYGNPLQDQRTPSVESDTDDGSFLSASLRVSNRQHDYEIYDDFETYDTSDDPENYGLGRGHSSWDLEDSCCQDFDDIEDESDGEEDEDEESEDFESDDGNNEEDELDQTPTPPHSFLPWVQNLRSMTANTHSDIDSNNSNIDSPLQRTLTSECDSNSTSNENSRSSSTSRDASAYGTYHPLEMAYPMVPARYA